MNPLRVTATSIFLTFTAIIFFSQTPSESSDHNRSALTPTDEMTPEIIAKRGCVVGVAHPSGIKLSNQAQIAVCNDHVQTAKDKTGAIYFRALHLYTEGTSDAHRAQAYRDFTFVIAAEADLPAAFGNRALLNLRDYNAPERALADIEKAMALTSDRPRSYYFETRAMILLSFAERDENQAMIYAALEDIQKAKSLNPKSKKALQLEEWATEFLKRLLQNEARPVQKG